MASLKKYLKQSPNFLSIFIFAVFMLAHTSILLEISQTTGARPQAINYVFAFFTVGSIGGRLTAFIYNTRLSNRVIMIGCFSVLSALTLAITLSHSIISLYVIFTLSGYVLGVVYLQANKNLMESDIEDKARLANIGLSFYPIGASVGPLAASFLVLRGFSWKFIYIILVPLMLSAVILFIFLDRKAGRGKLKGQEPINFRQMFSNRQDNFAYGLIVFIVLTYCISEAVIFTWLPTFLRSERGFSLQPAGLAVTVFWVSVIAGRMLVGIFTGKVNNFKIMLFISMIGGVGILLMAISANPYLIFIFIALAGLGYSGVFPLLVSSGSQIFSTGRGLILTIIFAASSLGKAVTPYLIDLSSRVSMFLSLMLAAIFMALTIIMLLVLAAGKRGRNWSQKSPQNY